MTGKSHPTSGPVARDRAERERVQQVYDDYRADPYYRTIWSDSPASRFMAERKWQLIGEVLQEARFDARSAWVLDLGAGAGSDSVRFEGLGVGPERIVALDLLERSARMARRLHPWMSSIGADAARLPFRDTSFDLIYQSTMISSVLDARRRRAILLEIDRILAPGGSFLSYDTRYPNPWNRHTEPFRVSELAGVLTGWSLSVRSVTAIPQLVRVLAPVSLAACRAIESIPPLRSHLLVLARRPGPRSDRRDSPGAIR